MRSPALLALVPPLAVWLILLPPNQAPPVLDSSRYLFTDLGALADRSIAYAINDEGVVVGESGHPFLWRQGKLTDLGVFPLPEDADPGAKASGKAYGINAVGQVVGSSGEYRPLVMSGLVDKNAFIYSAGKMRALSSQIDGEYSISYEARAINARGEIVGVDGFRACLWRNGSMIEIKPLSTRPEGNGTIATGVNDRGDVVGATTVNRAGVAELPVHAFLMRSGKMRDLGSLKWYPNSIATCVNSQGQVVGYTGTHSFAKTAHVFGFGHAFRWAEGIMTDLGGLGPGQESAAYGINTRGEIVGSSNGRAVIWNQGRIEDLNQLAELPAGWVLVRANAINDHGCIVGEAAYKGKPRAFLLIPTVRT